MVENHGPVSLLRANLAQQNDSREQDQQRDRGAGKSFCRMVLSLFYRATMP
jgi:hypothetical protein